MSVLFFDLRGVPQDEADDVRTILSTHHIEFFETSAGMWGISLPAIWLYQADDLPLASKLFSEYQQQRSLEQRALYESLKQQGLQPGFCSAHKQQPVRFLVYSLLLCLVIYASIRWVFELGF